MQAKLTGSCGDRAAKANLLVTARPDLAAQLDPPDNTRHDLSKLTVGSKERADWLCGRSHHYEQRIDRRTTRGGCAICHNRRLAQGVNDAQMAISSQSGPTGTGPIPANVATERHPHLKGFARPNTIFPGTAQHYWKCLRHGHVHRRSFPNQIQSKGCPARNPEKRILSL
ncbi:MAG: hypothetical protein H7248_01905 [Microbacteriaceae bacterium]|nr:hypothetical protein [Microbacteriaceae bacterium]